MHSDLLDRFAAHLDEDPDLIPVGSGVVIGLSGGPDSMALLHLLVELREERRLGVCAAHFDHGLRPNSAGESLQVAAWAADLGVRCVIRKPAQRLDPAQAALREARYRHLLHVCEAVGFQRLATAHQADDQAETVLLRLWRGTDLRGLAGIPARRGRIVRPLLPFARAEILSFLRARGAGFLDDPSNADLRWARPHVRHEVLPALARTWGSAVRDDLNRLADSARRADGWLEVLAALAERAATKEREEADDRALTMDRETLSGLDPELQARVLRRATRRLGIRLGRGGTRIGVQFISRGRSGSAVHLGGGLRLTREYDELLLRSSRIRPADREVSISGPAAGRGAVRLGGRSLHARWYLRSEAADSANRVAVSTRAGHYPLRIRGWRPGDRIRLTTGSRKLKKLFNDRRVPLSTRARLALVVDRRGEVLWIEGLARAVQPEESGRGPHLVIELTDAD